MLDGKMLEGEGKRNSSTLSAKKSKIGTAHDLQALKSSNLSSAILSASNLWYQYYGTILKGLQEQEGGFFEERRGNKRASRPHYNRSAQATQRWNQKQTSSRWMGCWHILSYCMSSWHVPYLQSNLLLTICIDGAVILLYSVGASVCRCISYFSQVFLFYYLELLLNHHMTQSLKKKDSFSRAVSEVSRPAVSAGWVHG